MTKEQRGDLIAKVKAATQGEWSIIPDREYPKLLARIVWPGGDAELGNWLVADVRWPSNAEYIVSACNAVPDLCTDLDAAEARIAELEAALHCFLEDERFQVAVGGNPNVVEQMIASARKALSA